MNKTNPRTLPRLLALVLTVLVTTAVTVNEYVGSTSQPLAPRTRVCIPSGQPDLSGIQCWRSKQPDCPCDRIRTTS